jgi:hypothetical protein
MRDAASRTSRRIPIKKSMREDFLALSRILTGVERLDAELGRQYLDRLNSTPFAPTVREILEVFKGFEKDKTLPGKVKSEILLRNELRPALCQIILLWFTSAMQDNLSNPSAMRYGSEEEYFSGLAWSVMGAHVPGLSGGYFGHWRYRPDNEPLEDA